MIDKIVKLKTILERFFMGILKNFCRYVLEDEISKEISRYSTIIIDKNNEIDRLNYTSKQQEKFFKLLEKMEFDRVTLIKIAKDKEENYCLLYMDMDYGIIKLKGLNFSDWLGFQVDSNKIKIQDIQTHPQYENKGHGSLLLDCLIWYAKKNNIEEIYGDLDPGGNLERRIHFYKKFGFVIYKREKEFDKILLKLN